MNRTVKYIVTTLVAPVMTAAMLGGIAVQNSRHIKPENVEPFHAAAKQAIASVPYIFGSWAGTDMEVPQEAVKLLNSNIIISRKYVNIQNMDEWVSLLIVQCRDSRDMVGHYPPVCYPGQGEQLAQPARALDIQVGAMSVPVTEYLFQRRIGEQVARRYVYNFMAIPGAGLIRNMEGIYKAAEDYQRRYFGAAQFQLLMSAELSESQRMEILQTFLGANADLIRLLRDGRPAGATNFAVGEMQ